MVGLNRGDDTQLAKTANIFFSQVLGMLYPPASVSWPVLVKHLLIKVKEQGIGPVTDGMDSHLATSPISLK